VEGNNVKKPPLGNRVLSILGRAFLLAWIFFWWGIVAWKNVSLFLVYPSLVLPWTSFLEYLPLFEIILSLAAMFLFWYAGHLFLNCLEIYLPRGSWTALSFTMGVGIVTFVGEIAGLFGLFYRWVLVALLGLTYIGLLIASMIHWRKPARGSEGVSDPRFYRSAQKSHAREAFGKTILLPQTLSGKIFSVLFVAASTLIVFLTFYHALFFPLQYWDSFSYLGMARSLFINHRFPEKIMAQMGVGTGSNYPQMFRLVCAIPSSIAGFWSDVYSRILAPFCGLFSLLLIYHTILRLSRVRLTALAGALVFACIPYGIRYFTYSSDYCLTILFTAAFLYSCLLYMENRLRGYLILSSVIAAFACHINYLMPLLFLGWIVLLFLVHWKRRLPEVEEEYEERIKDEDVLEEVVEPEFITREHPPSLRRPWFYRLVLILILLISPWYLRNWIKAGNPVYPYFSSIFGGKRIDPEILSSMQGEWLENGDGIETAAMNLLAEKIKAGKVSEEEKSRWFTGSPEEGIHFTLYGRIRSSFYYFVRSPRWSWALAPCFLALTLPGVLIWAFSCLRRKFYGSPHPRSGRVIRELTPGQRFGILSLFILVSFFGYHYLMAGYYLYQIMPVLVPMILFSFFTMDQLSGIFHRQFIFFWCVLVFIIPGLPFALMNFKLPNPVEIEGQMEYPQQLAALRRPGMPPHMFYRHRFGDDARMFDWINSHLREKTIMTHDNRYLLYDPSIRIVNRDDWDLRPLTRMKNPGEKFELLRKLKIDYYLEIPMQKKHRYLRKQRIRDLVGTGYLESVYQAGGNQLYAVKESAE